MRGFLYGTLAFFLSLLLLSIMSESFDSLSIFTICICTTLASCAGAIVNSINNFKDSKNEKETY